MTVPGRPIDRLRLHADMICDAIHERDGMMNPRGAGFALRALRGETFQKIATEQGVTRERIRQIVMKSIIAAIGRAEYLKLIGKM